MKSRPSTASRRANFDRRVRDGACAMVAMGACLWRQVLGMGGARRLVQPVRASGPDGPASIRARVMSPRRAAGRAGRHARWLLGRPTASACPGSAATGCSGRQRTSTEFLVAVEQAAELLLNEGVHLAATEVGGNDQRAGLLRLLDPDLMQRIREQARIVERVRTGAAGAGRAASLAKADAGLLVAEDLGQFPGFL